jgi:hypothetical protein
MIIWRILCGENLDLTFTHFLRDGKHAF